MKKNCKFDFKCCGMNFASVLVQSIFRSPQFRNLVMVTENGVRLQVDSQRRIGVADVINMLKGLRSEAVIKVVRTSGENENEAASIESKSLTISSESFQKSSAVIGNTDLPQIRELNEIAAILRSMDTQQNHFSF